jgi:hypothetical protein
MAKLPFAEAEKRGVNLRLAAHFPLLLYFQKELFKKDD